jgi:hypothetical protein
VWLPPSSLRYCVDCPPSSPPSRIHCSPHHNALSPTSCTTRNLEIYDVSRVAFNAGTIDLTYLWWYISHIILVGPRAYQNGWHFYDDSSIYRHKLKRDKLSQICFKSMTNYQSSQFKTSNRHRLTSSPMTFSFIVWRLQSSPNCE